MNDSAPKSTRVGFAAFLEAAENDPRPPWSAYKGHEPERPIRHLKKTVLRIFETSGELMSLWVLNPLDAAWIGVGFVDCDLGDFVHRVEVVADERMPTGHAYLSESADG